jgi:WD40 repeat protein
MGTPLSQLAFSSDFAQNQGTFKPVGTEIIGGREALIVEWTSAGSELPSWRMWLDTKTAVLLKMQTYGKSGGDDIRSESVVKDVSFDDVFANSLFRVPSAMPQFSDITGKPLKLQADIPAASTEADPLGEVYFFVSDHNYGKENIQLMKAPGSCVAGLIPCPQAEVIEVPSDLNFSLTPLVWSPKGEEAAFSLSGTKADEQTRLSLYDPEQQTWTTLAQFNYIDPPLWSPDGEWLAFRVQDGEGKDEIYLVRRDGSGLTNVSASVKLPNEGQPYVLDGWISNQIILRGRNEMVYLMRASDGKVQPLFDTPLAKSVFVPSPDGYFLAYLDVIEPRAALKLITPDGNTTRDLTAFEQASLYPIVWSPDGTQLAFVKTTNDLAAGQDLYTIQSDGKNLQQVYHSNAGGITDVKYSPDGRFLLIPDDDATGRHLFVVDLSTMEAHLIQLPNIPLDWWVLAPSWKK